MIQKDVARMERLLSEAREISRIDALLNDEERTLVRLDDLVPALVESFRLRLGGSGPSNRTSPFRMAQSLSLHRPID